MYFCSKHVLFALIALILTKTECEEVREKEEGEFFAKNVKIPKNARPMDDLKSFNMTIYCKFQPNDRPCSERRTSRKYYFDIKLQKCVQFNYGYCDHSYNMFDGRHLCLSTCRDDAYASVTDNVTANVFCMYQPDFGECHSYQPSFYFDVSERRCKGFAYSGCGGNKNRFSTATRCGDVCGGAVRLKEIKL